MNIMNERQIKKVTHTHTHVKVTRTSRGSTRQTAIMYHLPDFSIVLASHTVKGRLAEPAVMYDDEYTWGGVWGV